MGTRACGEAPRFLEFFLAYLGVFARVCPPWPNRLASYAKQFLPGIAHTPSLPTRLPLACLVYSKLATGYSSTNIDIYIRTSVCICVRILFAFLGVFVLAPQLRRPSSYVTRHTSHPYLPAPTLSFPLASRLAPLTTES